MESHRREGECSVCLAVLDIQRKVAPCDACGSQCCADCSHLTVVTCDECPLLCESPGDHLGVSRCCWFCFVPVLASLFVETLSNPKWSQALLPHVRAYNNKKSEVWRLLDASHLPSTVIDTVWGFYEEDNVWMYQLRNAFRPPAKRDGIKK